MDRCALCVCWQVVVGSVYCMSRVIRVAARKMANITSSYIAGTHSMAFVTVPDEQMARKLAKYILFTLITFNYK